MSLQLVNLSNGNMLAEDIKVADSFLTRLKGLMFTKNLHSGSGLYIKPCRSVHTFFMNYAIDILYVNDRLEVVAIDEALQPGKIGKLYKGVQAVIELSEGAVSNTRTKVGHVMKLK